MAKVVGLGGIFFQPPAEGPSAEALRAWYGTVLGLEMLDFGGALLWNEPAAGRTHSVFAVFEPTTGYFRPSDRPFMINLRVDDLEGLLAQVRERGGNVLDRREDSPDGRFGYVLDPAGTLLELWQPPAPGTPRG